MPAVEDRLGRGELTPVADGRCREVWIVLQKPTAGEIDAVVVVTSKTFHFLESDDVGIDRFERGIERSFPSLPTADGPAPLPLVQKDVVNILGGKAERAFRLRSQHRPTGITQALAADDNQRQENGQTSEHRKGS